ncbi:MAG: glycosyltransferase family 4 protein [Candidatus Neomarinimicrobiota bacterium]
MAVSFLVPYMHKLPTGGNIYNRRIIEYLTEQSDLDVKIVKQKSGGSIAYGPESGASRNSLNVVDSLLMKEGDSLKLARRKNDYSKWILMVHYLHLLDPSRAGSRQAKREETFLPIFDGFVVTSRYSRRRLEGAGIPEEKIAVIQPGLESRYRNSVESRAKTGRCRLLTVSNILPGKGLVELVGILEGMTRVPWRWDHVGDASLYPEYGKSFYRRLQTSSVREHIRLHGSLPPGRLLERYDRSHLFVVPSTFESCSMATMEAMARGLPVIAFRVGGLPEVGDGAARLISAGDLSAFSHAVCELIKNEDARRSLSRKGLNASKDFPSWRETGEKFVEFISTFQ